MSLRVCYGKLDVRLKVLRDRKNKNTATLHGNDKQSQMTKKNKKKVKFVPEQAMKAQRGSRGIAVLTN